MLAFNIEFYLATVLDYIYKDDRGLNVRYSKIGKVNLLKNVRSTVGTQYQIDYSLSQSSNECPQRYWNMSSLKVYDGYSGDGSDTLFSTFEYGKKHYSRYEREEYGYDTVIIKEYLNGQVYRLKTQAYHSDNFMFKGLMKYDVLTDNTGNKYVENIYDYQAAQIKTGAYRLSDTAFHCLGDVYPVLAYDKTLYYEGQNSPGITTERNYYYTLFGNLSHYIDKGNSAISNDDIESLISYKYDTTNNNYIVSMVDTIKVTDQNGNLFRQRSAEYTTEGSLSKLKVKNSSINSIYEYKYDTYGNIDTVKMPANNNGQILQINYQYDPVVHNYPTQVSNSLGYTSSAIYDYRWGKPVLTTDIAGNRMYYTYDEKGRTRTIIGPKEVGTGNYTIKYEYWDRQKYAVSIEDGVVIKPFLWATTYHYDPEHPTNNIITMTHSDGLGRVIQVRKDIEIGGIDTSVVSGWVYYDGLGRQTEQYQLKYYNGPDPIFTINYLYHPNNYELNMFIDTARNPNPPTTTTYDILDRPLQVTYPNLTTTQNTYGLGQDMNSIKRFKTMTTDQNGKQTKIYSDHRQLKTQITAANNTSTQFEYDALGQLLNSTDPEGQPTSYEYDMMGRRTGRNHPSAGQTNWAYDQVGNLTKQTMSSGEEITYSYNFNQLINVNYSDKYWNNVWYEYGGAGSGNQTGRLIKQQDATGVQEYEYGNMGELIKNRHTYVVPNSEVFTLTTEWEYDSWNRVKQIIYPDNEILTYNYNFGGLLKHVEGNKPNIGTTVYIEDITYDEYEQRTAVINGNQTRTYYTYDPVMRRMTNLKTINPNGDLLKLTYTYDSAGNITQIENTGLNPYVQEYIYDDVYQLDYAEGNWTDNNTSVGYSLKMGYSPSGRILDKILVGQRIDNQNTYTLDYDNKYTYDANNNPYALQNIIDNNTGNEHYFNWDEKGNMIYHNDKSTDNVRRLCWTEDNRLQAVKDNQMGAYYNYDATGERNLKLTGQTIEITQNGQSVYSPVLDQQTLYASALVTVNDKGYTKHYFEEGKRICSKIGSGELQNVNQKVDHMEMDYEAQRSIQTEGITNTYEGCMEITPYINNGNLYDNIIKKYEYQVNSGEPIFYYHSDHLGSASYITDSSGAETQQLVYLPFGEDWVDKKYNTGQFETPYKFNGKEKDQETGYNNFGARYYYYWASIWLSVDPMSDKYPHLTSYNYCANNPVMLVDPEGRDVVPAGSEELNMIRNTLPENERQYVQLDDNGHIDKDLLNSYKSESYNYKALQESVNSDKRIEVSLDDNYNKMDENGVISNVSMPYFPCDAYDCDKDIYGDQPNGLSTGESGTMGVVLLPTDNKSPVNSPDNVIRVIVNKNLSEKGRAESYSHEGNGHALMFVRTNNREKSGHIFSGPKDLNKSLVNMIITSKKETIRNMK
ncbi:hypothetical protein SDC9_45300 [bioreactor metagenome]|uniref:Uncharacterized protein n=1 Tax=bioreactor metagenome TaxID=1076179 RepID=A0A644W5M7_9ZZZZ